ncbi:G-protein coupled receptor 12 isoform X1 [Dermochelys coriacea]|uniref:G-protein coupled receptor 12 isoform X1 n=1 Tax=Dermochelys coriacea TaxID=27794 RepID=UPI001CA947BD|nr:G-protein coupled receptor 12 isoform X1 [Dermochelys coriacea]
MHQAPRPGASAEGIAPALPIAQPGAGTAAPSPCLCSANNEPARSSLPCCIERTWRPSSSSRGEAKKTGVKMNEDLKVNLSWLPQDHLEASSPENASTAISSLIPVVDPEPELIVNPWDIVLCTSGTLISCENAIVVLIIFQNPNLRAPMFLLIGSLALADLLAGIGLIINFIFAYLLQSEATKLVTIGLIVASFSASVCSLLAITVDRYLSLYYALTYNSERTVTFTYIMLILLWGASICIGLLPIMGWNCLKDESTCSVIRPLTKNNAAILSVSFLLMFALMLQLYIQICKIVMRHAHQIALQHHFLATSHYVTTRKGVSTLAIILGTFAACWIPFTLYSLIADYTYPSIYTYATLLPATYNSIINPVIYAFRNQEIQKAFWLICCGCIPSSLSQRARSPSDV